MRCPAPAAGRGNAGALTAKFSNGYRETNPGHELRHMVQLTNRRPYFTDWPKPATGAAAASRADAALHPAGGLRRRRQAQPPRIPPLRDGGQSVTRRNRQAIFVTGLKEAQMPMDEQQTSYMTRPVEKQIARWLAQGENAPKTKAIRGVEGWRIREPRRSEYGDQAITTGERRIIRLMAAERPFEHGLSVTTGRVTGQWIEYANRQFALTRSSALNSRGGYDPNDIRVSEVWAPEAKAQ